MSGITKEQIYAAANKLAADGVMPSNDKVRAALGNTGSEATIQKYLKEWKYELLVSHAAGCVFCADCQKRMEEMQLVLLHVRQTLHKQLTTEVNYAPALSM